MQYASDIRLRSSVFYSCWLIFLVAWYNDTISIDGGYIRRYPLCQDYIHMEKKKYILCRIFCNVSLIKMYRINWLLLLNDNTVI